MKKDKIIEVKNLTKKFDRLVAVDDISFSVDTGEMFAFLGPNGAGKTTTINILTTQLTPTKGVGVVAGFDVITNSHNVRKNIGIIFQDPSLDVELTAWENLKFHGMLYGLKGSEIKKRSDEVLEMVGLDGRRNSQVKTFSGGMKRRLEIARGLLHHPKILFLDEPTIGLDPQSRFNIWEHIFKLMSSYKMTLFLTTHYMEESENCDRVAIIDGGKIMGQGSPAQLKKKYKKKTMNDVFLTITGKTVRDEEKYNPLDKIRQDLRLERRA